MCLDNVDNLPSPSIGYKVFVRVNNIDLLPIFGSHLKFLHTGNVSHIPVGKVIDEKKYRHTPDLERLSYPSWNRFILPRKFYQTGFHVFDELKDAQKYLDGLFFKGRLVIYQVEIIKPVVHGSETYEGKNFKITVCQSMKVLKEIK